MSINLRLSFIRFPSSASGRRALAMDLVEESKRRQQKGYVPAAFVNAYLGVGDKEQAFAWMEWAYQEQSMILQYLKVHPFFDPVRGDPASKIWSAVSV